MRIYFAAPLHDSSDQMNNTKFATELRNRGHLVYLPQEHGLWEDLVEQYGSAEAVRKHLFQMDLQAMQRADVCVAHMARKQGPSEGMIWEMGYMAACNKPVYLVNDTDWKYNLMPEFGSQMFTSWKALFDQLHTEAFQ